MLSRLARPAAERLLAVLCGLVLMTTSACTIVNSSVEGASAIPADFTPRTVYITPAKGTSADSVEWPNYAGELAKVLGSKGFATVASRKDAALVATFGYTIGNGQTERVPRRVPIRDVIGHETRTDSKGHSHRVAVYGIVGYEIVYDIKTFYSRLVTLQMTDTATGKQVFRSSASSRDQCGSLTTVIGPMVESILKNFPQAQNGVVVRTDKRICAAR